MGNIIHIQWAPPGPVSAKFFASQADVQLLNGPIGSGKTSTVLVKAIHIASQQQPSTLDGIRKFKLCVVRDTYRMLWKTTIPSWWEWMPKKRGTWAGAKDGPATHEINLPQPDGTMLNLIVEFLAIGENSVEELLRGYQPTAFYLNEMDMLAEDVLTFATGRIGRYPPMREGGASWSGILGDFNAPELDGWLNNLQLDPPPGMDVFRQPGGLAEGAENLHNLLNGREYYHRQIRLNRNKPGYVKRMVHNVPGYSSSGKAVYPDFNDDLHVSEKPLPYHPGLRLEIGLDAGLTPAAIFYQVMPDGQKRVIGEFVPGRCGPTRFSRLLVDHIKSEYPQARFEEIRGHCDPSAVYGGDGEDDKSWVDILRTKTKLTIRPAETNNLSPRLDAVREPLNRMIGGTKPEFIISNTCKWVRKGFNGGYRYAKITGSNSRFSDTPEKNEYSHPHDALQYVVMSVTGSHSVSMAGQRRRQNMEGHRQALSRPDGGNNQHSPRARLR